MLGRILQGLSDQPTIDSPRRVPYWGDPELKSVGGKALRGDWVSVESVLRSVRVFEVRDEMLLGIVHQINGRPKWLDEWVAARPGDHLALTFRGAHSLHWAWEARGHKRAARTPRSAFDRFFARLRLAREDLAMAASLAPSDDPGPWVHQLTMARGLQYEKPALWGIFEELRSRSPWHPICFSSMIQGLAPKWWGSWDTMMELAKSTSAGPEGSSVHVALVEAHREAEIETQSVTFWNRPEVREDILAAAARSIESPLYTPTPRSLRDHNWFLYAFGRLGEAERFDRELAYVQGRLTAPFAISHDPTNTYKELRAEVAFKAANRRAGAAGGIDPGEGSRR